MTGRLLIAGCAVALGTALLAQDIPPPPPPPPPSPISAVARDAPTGLGVGRASLSGRVVTDETTPQPVRRASVRLGGVDSNGGRIAVTDDAGRFAFAGLPAGRYVLTPTREGFVGVAYGAKRPDRPGWALTIADGQQLTDVVVRMLRGAVITGTVRDETGQPAPGQLISVMRYGFSTQTGERALQPVRGLFSATADDRGIYRVYGLAPGDYVVVAPQGIGSRNGVDVHRVTAADVSWATQQIQNRGRAGSPTLPSPPRAPNILYAPVFFPGVPNEASATTITLSAGQERAGVDISLLLVPTAAISGTVSFADGSTPTGVQLFLLAHDRIEGLAFSGFSSVPTVVNGKFTFTGLTPGRYTVTARPASAPPTSRGGGPPPSAESMAQFALTEVNVDGQDVTVALRLQTGATVAGRLAFSGTLPPPADLSRVRVALSAVIGRGQAAIGVAPATVDASGAFDFAGVAPGRYRLSASVPGSGPTTGWQVRSAMVAGSDALDTPLEIGSAPVSDIVVTFTDRPADLSGRIQDAKGQPAPEYFVIVFASDKKFWTPQSRWIQAKRPASDGRFTFPNLPPGTYNLAAVTDVEQGEWFDPSFLAQLAPASITLTIVEGEKKIQDIQVAAN